MQIKALLAVFKFKRIVARWYGIRVLDYPKKILRITTNTIREYDVRARSVYKEPETVAWIEAESKREGVFYDVGANVGAYSLIAAACGLDVIAFEPAPQNYAALHENISLNDFDKKITALPIVLGAENGLRTFSFSDYSRGATEGFFSAQQGKGIKKEMLVGTLDTCIREYKLSAPAMMKIDVDGGEIEVLMGAVKTLIDPNLRSVLIEVEEGNRNRVESMLVNVGFVRMSHHDRFRAGVANLIYTRA